MSAQKFACPHCEQHIEADERYAGAQIQCPSCGQEMVIPGPPSAPAVSTPTHPQTTAGPLRVSLTPRASDPPASAPPPPPPPAPRQVVLSTPRRLDDEEPKGSKARTIALIAAVLVVLAVAGYYAFNWASGAQKRFNEARAKDDDPGMVGGEVGHVAELYQVMEMTDRASVRGAEEEYQRKRRGRSAGADAGKGVSEPPGPESLPLAAATWSLEADAMQIPKGRLAGSVSGSNFVGRSVVLYTGSATPILALRQNDGPNSDAELMVYLRIKPGEKLEGRTWTIAKDESAGVPQVVKRWRTGPRAAPQIKSFNGGYAMKLEFGKLDEGNLPGQLYLALPDAERSVVGGAFSAEIRVLNTAQNQARPGAGASFEE